MKSTHAKIVFFFVFLMTMSAYADKTMQRNWLQKVKSLKSAQDRSAFIAKSVATVKNPLLFQTVAKTIIELHSYKKYLWIQGVVPNLIKRLKDKNKTIQTWSIVALGELKAKKSFPYLCKLANQFIEKLKQEKDKKQQKAMMEEGKELVRAVAKLRNKKTTFQIISCEQSKWCSVALQPSRISHRAL